MKFLPLEDLTYKTRLSEQQLIERLFDQIGPSQGISFGFFGDRSPAKPYEGFVAGRAFEMKRIIRYRNSFLPVIRGTIVNDFDGLTIRIKMRLQIFVIIFMCIWCGGVGIAAISILTVSIADSKFNPVIFGPMGMLLFAYILATGAFKLESIKSRDDLKNILDADLVKE